MSACGSAKPAYNSLPAAGDAAHGRVLFEAGTNEATACSACHARDDAPESGPSLRGIAAYAGSRTPSQSAEDYLFTSIVEPDHFIVAGYSAGIMPGNYGKTLTPQQLRDLIAYLMTLN